MTFWYVVAPCSHASNVGSLLPLVLTKEILILKENTEQPTESKWLNEPNVYGMKIFAIQVE
jgi:hypothetical protein